MAGNGRNQSYKDSDCKIAPETQQLSAAARLMDRWHWSGSEIVIFSGLGIVHVPDICIILLAN